jgi:hypothetical protein
MKENTQIPKQSWEIRITWHITQVWCEDVNWIHLAENRNKRRGLVNTVLNLWSSYIGVTERRKLTCELQRLQSYYEGINHFWWGRMLCCRHYYRLLHL